MASGNSFGDDSFEVSLRISAIKDSFGAEEIGSK